MLVAAHVYGIDSGTGLTVRGDTLGRYLTDSLEYVRMPLFTVISGYVYALRPVADWGAVPSFMRAKTRRLLVPLVPLVALVGGLQIVSGGGTGDAPSVDDVARGYVYGYSHLWFLQSIFLVMAVVAVLDAVHLLDGVRGWTTALVAGGLVYVLIEVPRDWDVFRLSGALLLFPFFLLGYGLVRHAASLRARPVTALLLVAVVLGVAVQQVMLVRGLETAPLTVPLRALAVAVGLGATAWLFRLRHWLTSRPLAWIGGFAFTVYLLHTMGAAATRLGLGALGVDDNAVLFTAGMTAGILLPILFEVLFGRFTPVRVFLLGEKPLPRRGRGAQEPAARAG